MTRIKQVIVANEGLNMSPGKLAAQVAHASIGAFEIADKDHIDAWKRAGVTKVVLGGKSEQHLIEIYKLAIQGYLAVSLIADEGRTEIPSGSITAVAIGPAPEAEINKITSSLPLYGKVNDALLQS